MYLGMTEEDYLNVLNKTPRNVADKLGIENVSLLSDEVLGEKIRLHDQTAFTLMQSFVEAYQAWWIKSNEVGQLESPGTDKTAELVTFIDRRDEIRRALLNYLNFVKNKSILLP
jgi:plasmid maintenance system antidote protein VapI